MVKLNLGSGWHYLDGYVNVDLHHDADVKADLRQFECAPCSVDSVLTTHTIEHLTRDDGIALIRRCYDWIKPGGRLEIETPDRTKCRLLLASRPLEGAKGLMGGRSVAKREWHEWLLAWVAAGADPQVTIPADWNLPGEAHLCVWNAQELIQALSDAGFVECVAQTPVYHGGRTWRDCRVVGTKPDLTTASEIEHARLWQEHGVPHKPGSAR